MQYIEDNETVDYLKYFKLLYQNLLVNDKLLLEMKLPEFFIDFDMWKEKDDGTGFAHIWIQPKEKLIYFPTYSPFNDVEIKGLQMKIITKMLDDKMNGKLIRFEVFTFFNPERWRGRNELNMHQPNKVVITGFNRTVLEEEKMFSTYLVKYVEQNMVEFIVNSVEFYTLRNR
ncbi:MAG: hypothetical protein IPL10_20970 [Bacteroidetes bacterium]|nr:hypothetical protein [Bacteroidota bacterium]